MLATAYHFEPEERDFLAEKLPDLPKNLGHRVLKAGRWDYVEPGTVLISQGLPVRDLVYLARGEAEVHIDGDHQVTVGGNQYFGEITCLSAEPTSATVTARAAF